jgi:hypothetical protein
MGNSSLVMVLGKDEDWNGIDYEKLVPMYWNWLVGPRTEGKVSDSLFFMRANHRYKDIIDPDGKKDRRNFEEFHMGNANVSAETVIFLPVADAEFDDGYLDETANSIDENRMSELADLDIRNWTTVSPKIHDLSGQGDEDIVSDLAEYRITSANTFDIIVPPNSELAEYLDDRFPPSKKPYSARTDGYYIAFRILKGGSYKVTSFNEDPTTNKTSNMEYTFTVS